MLARGATAASAPVTRAHAARLQLAAQPFEREPVALLARPLNGRDAEVADDRHAAELLARLHVAEVHLDRRQRRDLERVADRPRVVGPGAGVQHEPVGDLGDLVQLLDELALEVRLQEADLEAQVVGPGRDLLLEAIERQVAVVRRRRAVPSWSRFTPCRTSMRLRASTRASLSGRAAAMPMRP